VGIGLFLTFIGLKNAGIVAADPVTFVRLGHLDGKVLMSLGGLVLTVWLMLCRNPLAFLAGIFAVTAAAWGLGYVTPPARLVSPPEFGTVFLKLDVAGALKVAYIPAMLAVAFTDLFDSLSTFVGVAQASGLVDERGEPKRLRQGLIVDALATLTAGLFGTSSGTAYIESVAGIEAGGRGGLTAVVTALCFLPCLFLAPMVGMVPAYATAPALIVVGALMFRSVAKLRFEKLEEGLPQFLVIVLIPLTFSITQGLLWGFLAHVVLFILSGRRRELSRGMLAIGVVSVVLLALENTAAAEPASGALTPWTYDVAVSKDGRTLEVEAFLGPSRIGPLKGPLSVLREALPYVHGVKQSTKRGLTTLTSKGDGFRLEACPADGCRVRYAFALSEAADRIGDPDLLYEEHGVYAGSPSAWLLHPPGGDERQPVRIRVKAGPLRVFAAGLPTLGEEAGSYQTTADHLDELAMALLGPVQVHRLTPKGGVVDVAIAPAKFPVGTEALLKWATTAATAVTTYYDRFPVAHALVYIRPADSQDGSGVTFGDGGATIMVPVRDGETAESLMDDWVMTHEMVHTALPSLHWRHHWLEEGLATYIEPIARIRAGQLTATRVFWDMAQGLPNGLPEKGDHGLDHTPTWGRTYWGGALFCFLADIDLRRRSGGRIGLETAMKGVLAAGGSIADDWEIDDLLAVADKATGYTVLRDLYDRLKDKPVSEDLSALWSQLGVEIQGGRVRFDDSAPLAYVRRGIVSGRPVFPPPAK
jgi:hypothetical protein